MNDSAQGILGREEEGTHCRMNCTASSYFIPLSMRAKATKTGALEQGRERKGGGKNRRLKVRVHTDTQSNAWGGVKTWERSLGNLQGCVGPLMPCWGGEWIQQKLVIIYSKATFTFPTEEILFFFQGGGVKSQC